MSRFIIAVAFLLTIHVEAAQTNGSGGGRWTDPGAWLNRRAPARGELVEVKTGDALIVPVGAKARCGALMVIEGGRVAFEEGEASLTCAGDVDVKGALTMGPGSRLEIDCPGNMRYGVLVPAGGALLARGSHPFDRNCAIRAAKRDGRHNTYVHISRGAAISFRFCEFSHLGGKWRKGTKTRARRRDGVETWSAGLVEGCHFHHSYSALKLAAVSNMTVRHNVFSDNRFGLTVFRSRNVLVMGNEFQRNDTALSVSGAHWNASCRATENLFHKNRVGASLRGLLARSAFYGNVYLENETGLLMASANAPVAQESFVGNRYAVELSRNIVGARLTECVFGVFQADKIPNQKADVLVAALGPSGLTLNGCLLDMDKPVEFAPATKGKSGGARWVVSRDHNGHKGQTRRWAAAPGRASK